MINYELPIFNKKTINNFNKFSILLNKNPTFLNGLIRCLSVKPHAMPEFIVIMSALKLFVHRYLKNKYIKIILVNLEV